MKIGFFSKLGASGGSEHRCAELANGIKKYTEHEPIILCEKNFNNHVQEKLHPEIEVVRNVFKDTPKNYERLYDVDRLLVLNSDSYSFTKLDYWKGVCKKHERDVAVDLSRIPQMTFLFNFVISPAKHLHQIERECKDVRLISTASHFIEEIEEKWDSKFRNIQHIPRLKLESPIDPDSITTVKTPSDKIRIGKHSKAHGYKFNDEHAELIKRVNDKHGDKIIWDFLGVPGGKQQLIEREDNVIIRPEYSVDVGEYLQGIDIFLFFISWGRNEPWARSVAEGLMSGCPVLATNKGGNKEQVKHLNNGYLCDTVEDFEKHLNTLIENPKLIKKMGRNSALYSKEFTTEKITKSFMDFIL